MDVVVKVGGGLLSCGEELDRVLAVIRDAARHRRVLVVPGGGPFADAVRTVDDALGLSDDAAHWMAILAMDQYAHVLADRLQGSALVADRAGIAAAFAAGRIPLLTPYHWLHDADPLPHSWDVTSDSIAAWVAGAVGAPRLVLVKPRGASGADLVDAYFRRALAASVESACVAADEVQALRLLISEIDQTLNAGG